jgi:NSS family neurotransmitter:Na+ symporter
MSSNRESLHGQWSSKWVFILAAAGSAVGLGNIWRFPYVTGENGGGAFVLVYLACVFLIGIPVMIAELMIGRRGRRSPINAMRLLASEDGLSPGWTVIGYMGIFSGFLILSFYSVVAGWSLAYISYSVSGDLASDLDSSRSVFEALIGSAPRLAFWHTLFMGLVIFVIAKGVTRGLERAVKILMPLLFVSLIAMVIYALFVGDAYKAVTYLFYPDFSKLSLDSVIIAVGQAFFSLSLGMGALMIYGSYLPQEVSIPGTSVIVGLVDSLVALLAGLAIFPIVFGYGLEVSEGPGLVFVSLTIAFANMPFGEIFGFVFFVLLSIAAWTSAISLLEPVVAWLIETRAWSRSKSSLLSGGAIWLVGLLCLLSFNEWQEFTPLGRNIFEWSEFVSTSVLLPAGGLLISIFVGWRLSTFTLSEELNGLRSFLYKTWYVLVKYLAPLGVTLVFLESSGLRDVVLRVFPG